MEPGLIDRETGPHGPGRIVWLASYPKSGNTWTRVVLGHLLGVAEQEDDINALASQDGIASCRQDFDDIAGVNAAELTMDQVDDLRPRVYERLSLESNRNLFLKAHDAYLPCPAGEPMFPLQATWGVVHIVRNPLDVAVSLAHHVGTDLAKAIRDVCDPSRAWCARVDRLSDQLRQRLLDWRGHTASWLDAPLPRLTVRYEDMLARPHEIFGHMARFCGLDVTAEAIDRAVAASRFERLRDLETQHRFKETPRAASRFFREGRAGGWKGALTPEQVAGIVASQGEMMARLGYDSNVSGLDDLAMATDTPCPDASLRTHHTH